MPKKKQYDSALGSVFDFIFTEASKPPTKQKPVKVTGVDGSAEYVDAIAAVLESPGQFVNKTTVDAFNDLVDPELAVIDLGPNEKIKFTLLKSREALTADRSFIDKQFKRIEDNRKLGKMAWAGEQLSGLVAATWARKYGLDLETQDALFNLGSKESFLDKSSKRPEMKLGAWGKNRDYIERALTGSFGNYRTMSRSDFQARYGTERGDSIYKDFQTAVRRYNQGLRAGEDMGEVLDEISEGTYKSLYPVFEVDNLSVKEVAARSRGDHTLANRYQAAMRGIDLFAQKDLRTSYIARRKTDLEQHRRDLETLQRSSSPNRTRIKNLQKQIRDGNKELRMFRLQSFAEGLGAFDGLISSTSDLWGYTVGGGLVPAILNGDFFDERKNTMFKGKYLPVTEGSVRGLNRYMGPKFYKLNKFYVARSDGNPFMNRYYQMMTDLYYMTPASWMKTLGTGEGFAYRAYKRQKKFEDLMRKEGWFSSVDLDQVFGTNAEAYISSLSGVLGASEYNRLVKFVKNNERLQKLAYRFGGLNRLKTSTSKFLAEKLKIPTKAIRKKIGGILLRYVKGDSAKKLIGKWVNSGGFKYLTAGLKASIKAALGVTTAGASVFVGFVVDVAMDLVVSIGMKIAKPVIEFGFTGLLLLVLSTISIPLMIASSITLVMSQSQYTHIAPNEVVLGETDFKIPYTKLGGSSGVGDFIGGVPIFDGTVQEIFDQVAASMGVNFQLELIDSSDPRYNDGAWWCISATPIYCKADKVLGASSEYLSRLFRHEIIHQFQYAGDGYEYVRGEWGADFLSGNGGGYRFSVNGGPAVRATETREYFLSAGCTEQDLEDVALARPGSLSSPCGVILEQSLTNLGIGN